MQLNYKPPEGTVVFCDFFLVKRLYLVHNNRHNIHVNEYVMTVGTKLIIT